MSLLSPDCLNLFLAPGRAIAVRRTGLIKSRVTDKVCHASTQGPGHADSHADSLDAYAAALGQGAAQRVRIVLSNHFVQYQLQPWRDDLNDVEEEVAYARHGFSETYGPLASAWDVQVAAAPPGQVRVAAAVPSVLLRGLYEGAQRVGARIDSIQPYFAAAFNTWHAQVGSGRATWLVTHEPGRLCLGLAEQGLWRWLRGMRAGDDWRQTLPDIIENEMLLADASSLTPEVLVCAPSEPMLAIRAGSRLPYLSLRPDACPGYTPDVDSEYGLAMIG